MLTVISPAKTLDLEHQTLTSKFTLPPYLEEAKELVAVLARKSEKELGNLMGISPKLAKLNAGRFVAWSVPFTPDNAKQAILMFKGDVYQGLECSAWSGPDFTFAQKHLRILSGLYGILRPLDLIQPYRLEMGTPLKTKRGKSLYEFWGEKLAEHINGALSDMKIEGEYLINLASNEYFEAVPEGALNAEVITPKFKDWKNGSYKFMSFYAKRARGMMADFIVRNRILEPDELRGFDCGGYRYDEGSSDDRTLVFLRDES